MNKDATFCILTDVGCIQLKMKEVATLAAFSLQMLFGRRLFCLAAFQEQPTHNFETTDRKSVKSGNKGAEEQSYQRIPLYFQHSALSWRIKMNIFVSTQPEHKQ